MVIKPFTLSAAMWLTAAVAALAECGASEGWAMVEKALLADWKLVRSEEFDTSEGPGDREVYKSEWGDERHDEFGCASYYCLHSLEIKSDESHGIVHFYTWGGANFPEIQERSVLFQNLLTGESCLLDHAGGEQFRDHALTHLMRSAE